jgi:Sulfotransferase family
VSAGRRAPGPHPRLTGVGWQATLNRGLSRAFGYELRHVGGRHAEPSPAPEVPPADRLLQRPAFVLSTVRSGSTLLRVLLDSHPDVHAPHELHLRDIQVKLRTRYARRSLRELGIEQRQLRYLLWDRLLQRVLAGSGKSVLVNKTPSDVFIVERILECWPDARLIFLLRHPAAIARSRLETRPQDSEERNTAKVLRYGEALERARRAHPGLTVRYEELTRDPEGETRRLCAFLEVPWDPRMLEYGRFEHGRYRPGLGDWKGKIHSGTIQPAPPDPPPEAVPEALRPLAEAWGYLPRAARAAAAGPA